MNNNRDRLASLAWFRLPGLVQQALVVIVGMTFFFESAGCAGSGTEADIAANDARLVKVEVVAHHFDPDAGEMKSVSIAEDEFTLGEYRWHDRILEVDGTPTTAVEDILEGQEIVVPLRAGGSMTLARQGDALQVIAVDASMSIDLAQMPRVQIGENGVEVYSASDDVGRVEMKLHGIDDLPEVRRSLALSLGLDVLLASVEDSDTPGPAAIAAIVAAVVGAAWMVACGTVLYQCIRRCDEDFEVRCGGLDVEVRYPRVVSVRVSPSFGCRCR